MDDEHDEADQLAVVNIVGERVALGPLRRDLVPLYHRWRNDFWVGRTVGNPLVPTTLDDREAWFERERDGVGAIWFTVYERAGLRPIGLTDLFAIEAEHGIAWLGMQIGEADARGKGFGTETTRLMLDYAFTALNLHAVHLTVDEFNHAGRRAYEKAGFTVVGRLSGATLVAGRRFDRIVMESLAESFQSPVLRAVLEPETEQRTTLSP